MANKQRDEVALKVGDRVYTLVLDFEALCELEDAVNPPGTKSDDWVSAGLSMVRCFQLSYKHNRALLYASSRRQHKDLTLHQCGDLIEELGGVERFIATAMGLKSTMEPDTEDQTARPPGPRQTDGTGAGTTSKPDGLASTATASGG